jgi:hypothetical protein
LSPEGRSSAYLGGLTGTAARQAPLSEDVADRNVAAGQRLGGETLPATIDPNRLLAALDRLAVDIDALTREVDQPVLWDTSPGVVWRLHRAVAAPVMSDPSTISRIASGRDEQVARPVVLFTSILETPDANRRDAPTRATYIICPRVWDKMQFALYVGTK